MTKKRMITLSNLPTVGLVNFDVEAARSFCLPLSTYCKLVFQELDADFCPLPTVAAYIVHLPAASLAHDTWVDDLVSRCLRYQKPLVLLTDPEPADCWGAAWVHPRLAVLPCTTHPTTLAQVLARQLASVQALSTYRRRSWCPEAPAASPLAGLARTTYSLRALIASSENA